MNPVLWQRLGIAFALGGVFVPALLTAEPKPAVAPPQFFPGKVVPIADLLEKHGTRMDREAAAQWLALVTEDGKVYPLVKDDGSRMFFTEPQLLNRPMRLTARLVGNTNFLQVFQVHSLRDGRPHEVYWWCEVCIIKRFEKKDCDCCGAPMEFREVPVQP